MIKDNLNYDFTRFKTVFCKYPDIDAVYLFGSFATENSRPGSDLDLAIISKNDQARLQKLDILSDLTELGFYPVDLIFPDEQDLLLLYEAISPNRPVYLTNGHDHASFYSRVVRFYFDFAVLLDVQREAYKRRKLSGKA